MQLYVAPPVTDVRRPQRELRAFTKVHLEAGASTRVEFALTDRAFAYWDVDAAGWVIALADMPAIEVSTVRAVVGLLLEGALTAAPMFRGQRGHPVGFAAALRPRLLALSGDAGARPVLEAHPPQLIEVEDPGVLYDVDTVKEN